MFFKNKKMTREEFLDVYEKITGVPKEIIMLLEANGYEIDTRIDPEIEPEELYEKIQEEDKTVNIIQVTGWNEIPIMQISYKAPMTENGEDKERTKDFLKELIAGCDKTIEKMVMGKIREDMIDISKLSPFMLDRLKTKYKNELKETNVIFPDKLKEVAKQKLNSISRKGMSR